MKLKFNYLKFSRIPIFLLVFMFISMWNTVAAVSGPSIGTPTINFTSGTISFNAYRSYKGNDNMVDIFQCVEITAKVNGKTIGTVVYSPVQWVSGSSYSGPIERLSTGNWDVFGYATEAEVTQGTWNTNNDLLTYTIKIGSRLLDSLQVNPASPPQLQLNFKMWWGDRDNKDTNSGVKYTIDNKTIRLVPDGSWQTDAKTVGYSKDDAYPKTPTIQSIQPVPGTCYQFKAIVAKANGDDEKGNIYLYDESGNVKGFCAHDGTEITFTDQNFTTTSKNYYAKRRVTRGGITTYSRKTSDTKVEGYPQPQNYTLQLDNCKRAVVLTWKMPGINSQHNTVDIERSYRGTQATSFSCTTSSGNNMYEDKTAGKDTTYTYNIKCHPWNMACKNQKDSITTNFGLSKATNVTAKQDANVKSSIIVSWKNPTDYCGNTTPKLIIEKDGVTDTRTLADGDSTYVLENAHFCSEYRFAIKYETANYGDLVSTYSDVLVINDALQIGEELIASTGYYDDKISLEWGSPQPGLIDYWVVQRRIIPNGPYTIVSRFNNTRNSTVNYEDYNALPGILYEYKVYGETMCGNTNFYSPEIKAIGFKQTTGTVMGAITYGSGAAVEGVTVTAEILEESPYLSRGKAFEFNGSNSYMRVKERTPYTSTNGFSVQLWFKTKDSTAVNTILTQRNGQFTIGLNSSGQIYATIGEGAGAVTCTSSKVCNYATQYNHISAVYDGRTLHLYLNGEKTDSMPAITAVLNTNSSDLYIGSDTSQKNNLAGYIDEFRVWDKALSATEVGNNFNKVQSGKENNLKLYIRGEEAIDSIKTENNTIIGEAYDMANDAVSFTYYMNHAKLYNVNLTKTVIPTSAQLGYKGMTDANGLYTISAIPFAGSGNTYTITPSYDVHAFKPVRRTLYIGTGNMVHSQQDFEDTSYFAVRGKIVYAGTTVPVSGVYFSIDGTNYCVKDGKQIESDENGEYEISVPIGYHFITALKNSHALGTTTIYSGFPCANGRFPVLESEKYNFQAPETINFEDSTKMQLLGKFVGGPIQGKMPAGFGKAKNNVGQATIQLKLAEKQGFMTDSLPVIFSASNGKISTDAKWFNKGTDLVVEFTTNDSTGEFVVDLLPENYQVVNGEVAANTNRINKVVYGDVISMPTVELTQYLKNTDLYDTCEVEDEKNIDSVKYCQLVDWVYRVEPELSVTDAYTHKALYGDSVYVVKNLVDASKYDTLQLIDKNGNYILGNPVFTQGITYAIRAKAYEKYENKDRIPIITDTVPVVDASLVVTNTMASAGNNNIPLDENGEAVHEFIAGPPNITVNQQNSNLSYLQGLNFYLDFDDANVMDKKWRTNDLPTYVLGAKSTSNNFITRGPTVPFVILRDPPGSGSYAWLEKGSSITTTHEWGGAAGAEIGFHTETAYGLDLKTMIGGVGFATITDTRTKANIKVGAETSHMGGRDNTFNTTITTTERWETSSDENHVGPRANVYIGASYNIIFGQAIMLGIGKSNDIDNPVKSITGKYGTYAIGTKNGTFQVPQFATDFMYSRMHIEDNLIPNLELLRNALLTFDTTLRPGANINPAQPVFVSKLAKTDTNYAKNNWDTDFGSDAKELYTRLNTIMKDSSEHPERIFSFLQDSLMTYGKSYYIIFPQNYLNAAWHKNHKVNFTDSITFYNAEIAAWEGVIADDEKEMYESRKNKDNDTLVNRSFDAGVVYENTLTYDTCHGYNAKYDGTLSINTEFSGGVTINSMGVILTGSANAVSSFYDYHGHDTARYATFGYHLEDADINDYHSIDIYSSKGSNNSPAFHLLGGQTSCPYEGEITNQYCDSIDGKKVEFTIQEETVPVEDPYMTINPSLQTNIPGNRAAVYTLQVGNQSMVAPAWYMLTVDEKTNPDGLIIAIDGVPIGNGRVFSFDPQESFTKTLTVKRTRQDVTQYDSICLQLSSMCDDAMSSEIYLSAQFLPSCCDLALEKPKNNTIINLYDTGMTEFMVTEFDTSYMGFNSIVLEYAAPGSNFFTPFHYFYKDSMAYNEATGVDVSRKSVIDNTAYLLNTWKAPALDGNYLVRARSVCKVSPVQVYESITDEATVIKDMVAPVPFGSPQPADGILSLGEDILVRFNEDIQPNYTYRISVQGEINGDTLLHNYGLYFDGNDDVVEVTQPMNLAGKSFTVEFWTLRVGNPQEATLFSHGTADNRFEIGLTADDRMKLVFGTDTIVSDKPIPDIDQSWTHLSVVFDAEAQTVSAYVNGNSEGKAGLISGVNVPVYSSTGNIIIGSDFTKTKNYNGRINEVRVWSQPLTTSTIYTQMNTRLSGNELYLSAYWPMNEGNGTLVKDITRGRNGSTNASWFILPGGRSLVFNGQNQYAHTSILPELASTTDFSVEFWFNADADNANTCLLSTGRGDTNDFYANDDKFSIRFDDNKDLILYTANKQIIIGSGYADHAWHHFALSVNRRANANIYIDSELKQWKNAAQYFGAFKAVDLYVGALGWTYYADSTGAFDTTDLYFKGYIDDIRIWKSALTQESIKHAATSRLKGDEIGLRAYYPFDTLASPTLVFSTAYDQVKAQITNGELIEPNAPMSLFNGVAYAQTAANIKPIKTMKDVTFSRVYSNDEIYIALEEPSYKIENCVLDISVDDVTDMHGNKIESPVKWTAYINQNYLKWNENSFAFVKEEFEPLQFKVKVLNKSGLQQNFDINNAPSWLTVSQYTGTIDPLGSVELTFTIDQGLNIGTYDESIFLHNSNGMNDVLTLDVRVIGNEPDWEVDPNQFSYSMNVFGILEINGVVSNDTLDKLAAFMNDTCVGVTTLKYIAAYDNYVAQLTIYGNTDNAPLTFHIWDASTGTVYPEINPSNLTFKNATFLGTPGNPIKFTVSDVIEQHIALQNGWNWISTNVYDSAKMHNLNSLLQGFNFGNNNELKSQFDGFARYASGSWSGDDLQRAGITNTDMYMLRVNNGGILKIKGVPVDPAKTAINIGNGWNWIGYTPQINLNINEALLSLNLQTGDLLKSQTQFSMYDEVLGWIGELTSLVPGKGYMLYAAKEGSLVYPNISSLSSHKDNINTISYDMQGNKVGAKETNQSMVAEIITNDESISLEGATLYAYVNGECVGSAKAKWIASMEKYEFFLTMGVSVSSQAIHLILNAGDINYAIAENINTRSNSIQGSIRQPYPLTISAVEACDMKAYPNPFDDNITVYYQAAKGNNELLLTDVLGRIIRRQNIEQTVESIATWQFNALSKLPSGIYFIRLQNANGTQSVKVVK
ncbi:MAG: T9SS type A sorting domain-containing protein [Bacteroidales bacterium]|nr:T9SS type A sorting domain-containing protein [Bacteroidales bacterium]